MRFDVIGDAGKRVFETRSRPAQVSTVVHLNDAQIYPCIGTTRLQPCDFLKCSQSVIHVPPGQRKKSPFELDRRVRRRFLQKVAHRVGSLVQPARLAAAPCQLQTRRLVAGIDGKCNSEVVLGIVQLAGRNVFHSQRHHGGHIARGFSETLLEPRNGRYVLVHR